MSKDHVRLNYARNCDRTSVTSLTEAIKVLREMDNPIPASLLLHDQLVRDLERLTANDRFPKVHPRRAVVAKAEAELGSLLYEWRTKHDLTSAEYTNALAHELASFAAMLVKIERRGEESP